MGKSCLPDSWIEGLIAHEIVHLVHDDCYKLSLLNYSAFSHKEQREALNMLKLKLRTLFERRADFLSGLASKQNAFALAECYNFVPHDLNEKSVSNKADINHGLDQPQARALYMKRLYNEMCEAEKNQKS